jgi:hypothetical protein
MLNEWKKSVEGHWSSICEEWASEREQLKLIEKDGVAYFLDISLPQIYRR